MISVKSLKTVQTTAYVLKILAIIGAVGSFVGALGCLVGSTLLFALERDVIKLVILEEYVTNNAHEYVALGVTLIADAVICIGSGIVCSATADYLKNELADGTPFTLRGAKELMFLGIKTIAFPLGAIILASIICAYANIEETFTNEVEMGLGIALILLSFVFRYGAELEEKLKQVDAPAADALPEADE